MNISTENTQQIKQIYQKYTSVQKPLLTQITQNQMLIEMGFYPFDYDSSLITSFDDFLLLLDSKPKFNVNELKNLIKNVFGTDSVKKEHFLSKLNQSNILTNEEEEEFHKMYSGKEFIELDGLIDEITGGGSV
ncbi:hypothetical protein CDIK_1664 [Cucumispora dikerogammari]|nr:hypothetical protein CDIK_1664 [Cucumispora dikerogammari]